MQPVEVLEPQDLAQRMQQPGLLLLQITSAEVFAQAHIEGAQLVTPRELVCGIPPATGRLPEVAQLAALCSRIGLQADSQVVVYDDEGGGWAGRMGWTLDCVGHSQWAYLNGGLHSWAAAGLPLSNGPGTAAAPSDVPIRIDPQPIAEIADVLATIDDPAQIVWDVRSREEYMGTKQASARAGHIPGAVNFDWLGLKDAGAHQRLTRGIDAQLAELGIDGSKAIITHCQTHHRSGLSYLWGRSKGWDIRAYHGSWSEWGNRDDTPIDNPSDPAASTRT